jgi:hypothetical protein
VLLKTAAPSGLSCKQAQRTQIFITGGIVASQFLNLVVSLVADFLYSALADLLILLLINDIPVCSCKVAIAVTLGNFVVILRIIF